MKLVPVRNVLPVAAAVAVAVVIVEVAVVAVVVVIAVAAEIVAAAVAAGIVSKSLPNRFWNSWLHPYSRNLFQANLPGFRMPLGSRLRLTLRCSVRTSGDTACGHQRFLANPIPCSPVMAPFQSNT